MGVTLFEADALENPRAEIAADNEEEQNKRESSEPSHALNDLLQLVVEEESWKDIHTSVKNRAKSIHQQKTPCSDLDSSGSQGHKYAKGQEFRRREHF